MSQYEASGEAFAPGMTLAFGAFRLLVTQRVLLRGDRPVRLGSRALEILFALLEKRGEVISKNRLMALVWPGSVVEEGTLRVHIASLRKVLGDNHSGMRFIENVTGHGYRFSAPVTIIDASTAAELASVSAQIPVATELTRMIGRTHAIARLSAQVSERRLVTIVGAGGIGKTTLALATADLLRANFPDGVHLVNLVGITDPARVPSALASAFRQPVLSKNPLPGVADYLRSKRLLILLDNCEHLIGAVASLSEELLRRCAHVHILATSREPLRAAGEWVQRLTPLGLPVRTALSAGEALHFPAIQLFVERANAGSGHFQLRDEDVSLVVEICRKLDGLPLAIELAAACVDLFGLRGLAARLNDRLQILRTGRRTALPRHQTLRATIDWSYDILSKDEQLLLRRVAVFAGSFDTASAARVAGENRSPVEISDGLADLTSKSLLVADFAAHDVCYRLLNTTRAYALEKLEQQGEAAATRRRHAELCREWVWPEAESQAPAPAARIDDVRAALDWCFSPAGDAYLGVRLIVSSAELWFQLSFLNEYGHRVARALEILDGIPSHDFEVEMELNLLFGEIVLYMRGLDPLIAASLHKAYELAIAHGVRSVARECLWVLHCERIRAGDYQAALAHALEWRHISQEPDRRASETPARDRDDNLGDRMLALAYHLMGNPAEARTHLDNILAQRDATAQRLQTSIFQFDDRATALAISARVLWIQGFAGQAANAARQGVERALDINHTLSVCYALSTAATVHVWSGNYDEARKLAAQLKEVAVRYSLGYWQQWARCIEWGTASGNQATAISLEEAADNPFHSPGHQAVLATFDESFATNEVIARARQGLEGWCAPEILRAKAVLLMRESNARPEIIESTLGDSLQMARAQGALAWELRCASSLAQFWFDGGRPVDARELLQGVLARISDGQCSADVISARTVLKGLWTVKPVGRRALR